MRNDTEVPVTRRMLIMGCCSALLHVITAAVILIPGTGSEKSASVYRVEVKYLDAKSAQTEALEPLAAVPEHPDRIDPEPPAALDLTGISAPILPDAASQLAEMLEEAPESTDAPENVDILHTINLIDAIAVPVPPVENAIITPGGGLVPGVDTDAGGGNPLLAEGTERGWGGSVPGAGWGGGSGAPGSGGGTGGGNGGGTESSRGLAGAEPGVYFAGMPGITPPVYERASQPNYPEASRKRGEQGDVLLRVEVQANGRVGRAEVEESSGFALLDAAALRTIRSWRFKPALKGRDAVACWVNIPIRFRLN